MIVRSVVISSAAAPLDLSGWNVSKLNLTLANSIPQTVSLTVRTTTTETQYGSTATISKAVRMCVLSGSPCATPVGINPYVNYANSTAVVSTGSINSSVEVSPLVASSGVYATGPTTAQIAASLKADPNSSNALMEAWLQGLDKAVSANLLKEMMKAFGV